MTEPPYPPFDDRDLAIACRYLRMHEDHSHLMPPRKTLYVDWFLLRAISNEVQRRRTPSDELALLVSMVVREYVPDTCAATHRLVEAYKAAVMKIYSTHAQHTARTRRTRQARRRARLAPVDDNGQQRLI